MSLTWLVTVRRGTSLMEIRKHTDKKGMDIVLVGEPIPMGDNEDVLEIRAPNNFDKVLKISDRVLSIHRSSKPQVY